MTIRALAHRVRCLGTHDGIVYRGGPYAGQDDYLLPPPERLGAWGGQGYYQRTPKLDATGRVVYEWVRSPRHEPPHTGASGATRVGHSESYSGLSEDRRAWAVRYRGER